MRDSCGNGATDPWLKSRHPCAGRLFSRIACTVRGLEELPDVREAVAQQIISRETAIDGYSAQIPVSTRRSRWHRGTETGMVSY